MSPELKPFIHIIANLYLKYGYKEYPLCRYKQEVVDVKIINQYITDSIMHLHSDK